MYLYFKENMLTLKFEHFYKDKHGVSNTSLYIFVLIGYYMIHIIELPFFI